MKRRCRYWLLASVSVRAYAYVLNVFVSVAAT